MKKVLSILVVLMMLIGVTPTKIYAEDFEQMGNKAMNSYDEVKRTLANVAEVSQDAQNHINIKLTKNIKGRLNFTIKGAYIVFDANGKTIDGSNCLEAICLEHNMGITLILKGNGTYIRGSNYSVFAGSGSQENNNENVIYIQSATLKGNPGVNGNGKIIVQATNGYECMVTKDGENYFSQSIWSEEPFKNEDLHHTGTAADHVFVIKQVKHTHVMDQEVEKSEYLKQMATCVTPGIYYKSCVCGYSTKSDAAVFYTNALGHGYTKEIYSAFLRSKASNCQEHDTYWYVCTRCGKTSTVDFFEDTQSSGSHQYASELKASPTHHYYACTVEGCASVNNMEKHTASKWIIDEEATTSKEGLKHQECTVCHYVMQTSTIAKLNPEVKPTMTTENKTETKKQETKDNQTVKTGDPTNILEAMVLLVCSVIAIVIIKKRSERKE